MADLHNAGFAKTAYAKLEYVTCLNRCESENMSNITEDPFKHTHLHISPEKKLPFAHLNLHILHYLKQSFKLWHRCSHTNIILTDCSC